MSKTTHTLKDYKILVKLIIDLCEKGENQRAKDNRDSVDTAASFANGKYVAYVEMLNLIVNYKKEDIE